MLSVKHRIKKEKRPRTSFQAPRLFSNDILLMKLFPDKNVSFSQFGFRVSLKFSKKATERNRVKRWMRESVRPQLKRVAPGWKAVFFLNPKAPKDKLDLRIFQKKTEDLLKKAKILSST